MKYNEAYKELKLYIYKHVQRDNYRIYLDSYSGWVSKHRIASHPQRIVNVLFTISGPFA